MSENKSIVTIDDNFGSKQLLKDIAKHSHTIDIFVRLDGANYVFEGDFLKHVLPYVHFNQIDNDGIKATLQSHRIKELICLAQSKQS